MTEARTGRQRSINTRGPEWQGCEACHGPGKAHAESGDQDKIIRLQAEMSPRGIFQNNA